MTEEQEQAIREFIEWLSDNYEIHGVEFMVARTVVHNSTFKLEDTSYLLDEFKRRNEPRVYKSVPVVEITPEEFLRRVEEYNAKK